MAEDEDPAGMLIGLFMLACVGSCGYGAYALYKDHGPWVEPQEAFVSCQENGKTLFVGLAKGEPEMKDGRLRVVASDGTVTTMGPAVNCTSSAVKK